MKLLPKLFIAVSVLFLPACAAQIDPIDYSAYRSSDPQSIAIVPVLNSSNEPDAADYFLTTIAIPLAERGYYVFPTNMVKRLMEQDGLGDAGLVHSADPTRVAELFDADTVLFVEINEWQSNYSIIAKSISVGFTYRLLEGDTGGLIWQSSERVVLDTSSNSGNLLANLIVNAVTAAIDSTRSDFTGVARQANAIAINRTQRGLPAGPYSEMYGQDQKDFPSTGTGWVGEPKEEIDNP